MQLLTLNPAAISRTPSQALDPSSSSRLLPSPQILSSQRALGLVAWPCNPLRRGLSRSLSSRQLFRRSKVVKAVATPDPILEVPLTEENVESVLDEIRPYLMSDGGNVALHEIDGNIVRVKLQGACGSCPSSTMTMKMGIERRLMEKIPEIVAVEAVADEETGLELNEENIEKVLEEIRPYLIGTADGSLDLVEIEDPIVKIRITGPAAGVMTVRVAVTQKLREKIPRSFSFALIFYLFLHYRIIVASQFEGFDAEEDDVSDDSSHLLHHSLPPPLLTQSHSSLSDLELEPEPESSSAESNSDLITESDPEHESDSRTPSSTPFEYWDEDEFEGLPIEIETLESPLIAENTTHADPKTLDLMTSSEPQEDTTDQMKKKKSYAVEIACVVFLIALAVNYFVGKRENESLALAWAAKFASKDTIFQKNFSLLGVSEGEDSPLLLKEALNVFKFYASGRRYCHGLLATMELKSRHDLISRMFNLVVPCKDEITFEVYMNEDTMDNVVFAMARKKAAKTMQKEMRDLQRFTGIVSPPAGRKWVSEELAVISESKEVAVDMITDTVLDQVFGDKAVDKYGKNFMSMHISDQHPGKHKKMMLFKFSLPDAKHMDDIVRLVSLIPYYIDLVGRYRLSSQARNKTESGRQKAAEEAYKELQNARQEALQKKKAEKKKMMEEAEAKLSAEVIRKKEAKERARQVKKAVPKMKMSRSH
ncbi:hypothetical protein ARALYDRAFT_331396 [Arabidopsis lyrata subsp. lyrata]|uniref:NIF system FeS cluster assembly NifU C-terminal domain-containing protein n=1 Tax=Arabidopsis lyrata subsp. lyrata TaxID=81972 RepID=D7MPG6_ARALL|nr:hypothetical protein ARALYDRAFT_331396 [Arabidopsis lyrata subsp. lyrata]